MPTPSALHSKATPRWGTPGSIVALSRAALGGKIDLDPASSPEFNQVVQAIRIFTEHDGGLKQVWADFDWPNVIEPIRVFLNPPGGLVTAFWEKLLEELEKGHVSQAIWIGFSVEQLCTLQDSPLYPLDFATCILRKRLAFTKESGESGGSPSHGNYITGLGIERDLFSSCFGSLGKIHFGALA